MNLVKNCKILNNFIKNLIKTGWILTKIAKFSIICNNFSVLFKFGPAKTRKETELILKNV